VITALVFNQTNSACSAIAISEVGSIILNSLNIPFTDKSSSSVGQ